MNGCKRVYALILHPPLATDRKIPSNRQLPLLVTRQKQASGIDPTTGSHLTGPRMLDKGSGFCLVNISFLPPSWYAQDKPVRVPPLKNVTRQAVPVQVLLFLYIQVGDLRACEWFGIGEKIAVDLPIKTPFMDRWIPPGKERQRRSERCQPKRPENVSICRNTP